jgi:hypothetical protein
MATFFYDFTNLLNKFLSRLKGNLKIAPWKACLKALSSPYI